MPQIDTDKFKKTLTNLQFEETHDVEIVGTLTDNEEILYNEMLRIAKLVSKFKDIKAKLNNEIRNRIKGCNDGEIVINPKTKKIECQRLKKEIKEIFD